MVILSHRDLDVYKRSFDAAMTLFHFTKSFPREERYSLTDQMRRSSRSVSGQIAEAWQKRSYEAAFQSKLRDACAEAAETQTWLEFAIACGYLEAQNGHELIAQYDGLLRSLHGMIQNADKWVKN